MSRVGLQVSLPLLTGVRTSGFLVLRFLFLCSLLFSIAVLIPEHRYDPLNRLFAIGSQYLLEIGGIDVLRVGDSLIVGDFKARVIGECTPLFMIIIFGSFVTCYPAPFKRKIIALTLATLFFSVLTLIRIALLTLLGAKIPSLFPTAHVYFAQGVMVMAVVLAGFTWLRLEQQKLNVTTVGGFVLRFIGWSVFLFLAWLPLNRAYMGLLDHLIANLFAFLGYQLFLPTVHAVYFQTFNVVAFGSLVLSDRTAIRLRQPNWLLGGVLLLIFGHLLGRLGNVLATAFSQPWGFSAATLFSIVGQYLLPFVIWWHASSTFHPANGIVAEQSS